MTLIPGDGIGPDVTEAARRVVEATGVKVAWDVHEAAVRAREPTSTSRQALADGSADRVWPVASCPHSRENRLRRFLDNRRLEGRAASTGLGRLLQAGSGRGYWPVLDQIKIGAVEALIAAAAALLLLGVSPVGHRARRDLEICRHQPRHGTRRTLSALSVAMIMLAHPAILRAR
jgi:hypothetical protein